MKTSAFLRVGDRYLGSSTSVPAGPFATLRGLSVLALRNPNIGTRTI